MSKYIDLNEATDLFKGIDATMTGGWVADTLADLPTIEVSEGLIGQGSGDIDWQAVTSTGQEICAKGYEDGRKSVEVSEDCISREDAIKAYNEAIDELVKAEMEEFNLGDFTECSFNTTQLKLIARKIENAPSVVPSRAEGEWLFKIMTDDYHIIGQCSLCKELRRIGSYCPNCGAKMKGAEK